MTRPDRDIQISHSPTVTPITFETNADGERVEVRGEPKPNPLPYTVYVDGAYHGSTKTREKAEAAAAAERDADETITERAIRILQGSDIGETDNVKWIGMQHTGGGCLAAEIQFRDTNGYLMVTDPEMGYAKWSDFEGLTPETDADAFDAPYCVGVYDPYDEDDYSTDWVESVSGAAHTDAEMVEMVRKGIAYIRGKVEG